MKRLAIVELDPPQKLAMQLMIAFVGAYFLLLTCGRLLLDHHSLLSRLVFMSIVPAGIGFLAYYLAATGSARESKIAGRIALAICSGMIFLAIGSEYIHLCCSGAPWIEATAFCVMPLVVMASTLVFGVSVRIVVVHAALAVPMYLLAGPYLAWAHGDPTRTAAFWNTLAPSSPQAFFAKLLAIEDGQSLDQVSSTLGKATLLTAGEEYDYFSQLMCERPLSVTPMDQFFQWHYDNSLNRDSPASFTMQFRDGLLINFRNPLDRIDDRLPVLKPHPDAVANTHAAGEVDKPELVRFIVKDQTILSGIVIDEMDAVLKGNWQYSTHTPPYVGLGYLHDQKNGKGDKSVTYHPVFPADGVYEVRISHCYNVRRSTNTPVTIHHADGEKMIRIDQQEIPKHGRLFRSLGRYRFQAGKKGWVRISNEGTDGKYVIADAVQFIPVKSTKNPE